MTFKEMQELRNIINEVSDEELAEYAKELNKITTIEDYEPAGVTPFADKITKCIKDDYDAVAFISTLASIYAERWLNK